MLDAPLPVYLTAWLAMAGYFASWFAPPTSPWRRRLWTAAWFCYLLHVAAAFHFVHHWSHAVAAESTARLTAEVTGRPAWSGIYFNYVFTLVWTIDVAWWWLAPTNYAQRPRPVRRLIHGFLFFMVFNATVVFGHEPVRWLGIAACATLIGAWYTRSRPALSCNKV